LAHAIQQLGTLAIDPICDTLERPTGYNANHRLLRELLIPMLATHPRVPGVLLTGPISPEIASALADTIGNLAIPVFTKMLSQSDDCATAAYALVRLEQTDTLYKWVTQGPNLPNSTGAMTIALRFLLNALDDPNDLLPLTTSDPKGQILADLLLEQEPVPKYDVLINCLNSTANRDITRAIAAHLAARRGLAVNTEWISEKIRQDWSDEKFQKYLYLALLSTKPNGPAQLADIITRPLRRGYRTAQFSRYPATLLSTWIKDPTVQPADVSKLLEALAEQMLHAHRTSDTALFAELNTLLMLSPHAACLPALTEIATTKGRRGNFGQLIKACENT
jgi:hypothetical protein